MLPKSLLVILSIFLFQHLYSQKKAFKGYYINRVGDTITGQFPNYTEWSKNPSIVQFLPDNNSSALDLTPENTLKFEITGYDNYLSYFGQRLINPADFNQAIAKKDEFGSENQSSEIKTFVRRVIKADEWEVYEFTDKIRSNFYYSHNNSPLKELVFKMYYSDGRVNEVYEFRQQLQSLLQKEFDNRNIQSKFEEVNYTEESLSNLFKKIGYTNNGTKRNDRESGWIIAAGVSINTFQVSGDKNIVEARPKYSAGVSPILSIGYKATIDRNFGKYFLNPGVRFYNYKNSGEVTVDVYRRNITYKSSLIISPVLNLGVNILNGNTRKWFLSGGGGIEFLVNNTEVIKNIAISDNRTFNESEIKMPGLNYNIHFSTGVSFNNNMIISATYNLPATVGNYVFYNPKHASLQLTLGYKLK